MSNKMPVSGTVEQTSETGFKLGGKWFNLARTSENKAMPHVGDAVKFDAYGQQNNLFYRFTVEGNGNGTAMVAPGPSVRTGGAGGHSAPNNSSGNASRQVALMAAATLLAGSDGTVIDVAKNTVQVAQVFESWLSGQPAQDEEV